MPETNENPAPPDEVIYSSPPSEPDDDFWLEQGRKMITESLSTVRDSANALISALGLLQGIYLGILGFSKFIPDDLPLRLKALFIVPLLFWLYSLYSCVEVSMTERLEVFLSSPSDIREKSTDLILEKQRYLERAFWLLALGLLATMGLLIFRFVM